MIVARHGQRVLRFHPTMLRWWWLRSAEGRTVGAIFELGETGGGDGCFGDGTGLGRVLRVEDVEELEDVLCGP